MTGKVLCDRMPIINRVLLALFCHRYVKAYYTFMVDTAVLLGANRTVAEKDFQDVLDFEISIAKVKQSISAPSVKLQIK